MVSVVAVMTTAYVCHYCVHPLYCELVDATPKKFDGVAGIALTLCTIMYAGVGTQPDDPFMRAACFGGRFRV